MHERYQKRISLLLNEGKYRKLGMYSQVNKAGYLDFSTNDYLGLSQNPDIIEAAQKAAADYGVGTCASRIISHHNDMYEELERRIAFEKNTEDALFFCSGFQANVSALNALLDTRSLGAKPIVFFDKLNHASLYKAVQMSDVELVRYRHSDMHHLMELMTKYECDARPKFIVTETVFGMDGDVPQLHYIAELAYKFGAFLYLDEAHSTGMFGDLGYGISTTLDLSNVEHVVMGTFSKALGCFGGYIACSSVVKELLVNCASGFIYSTAPPPSIIGAALKAWDMLPVFSNERSRVLAMSAILRNKLTSAGFNIGASGTHIIPVILGNSDRAIGVAHRLYNRGILVSAIRPPTVPPGSARIRIAINAMHYPMCIEVLYEALYDVLSVI